MSIHIRKSSKDDLPAILALYAELEVKGAPTLDLRAAEQIFARMENYPSYVIYVAETEGEIIGTFALLIMDNLAHLGASAGVVENVVTHPRVQGQGVGKIMMTQAMKICAEAGCYKLVLSSSILRERAHQFYESLGFEKYGYSFRVKFEA